MVVEYIRYTIDTGSAAAFEQAYRDAAEALEASDHCECRRSATCGCWSTGRSMTTAPRPSAGGSKAPGTGARRSRRPGSGVQLEGVDLLELGDLPPLRVQRSFDGGHLGGPGFADDR